MLPLRSLPDYYVATMIDFTLYLFLNASLKNRILTFCPKIMVFINEIIGSFKLYHWWLCFMIFINKFGIAFHQMAIIFIAPPHPYSCPGNVTCCDSPLFDKAVFTRTIISEWNLTCKRAWLKDFTQTLFQFGVLLGSLLFGIASDRYGRRKTLIFSVVLEVFMGTSASILPDYWSFSIIRMVCGCSVGGIMVIGFVIITEYVGNRKRYIVSALYQVPFSAGHVILPAFGYYLRDYSNFLLAVSLFNVILLFYICLLPETPRWLLAVNRTNDAVVLMEQVAKINGMRTDDIRHKIEMYQLEHKSSTQKRGTVVDLFRTPNLRRNMLVMSFAWFACSYCFYGIAQYVSHLTGDIFINVAFSGACSLVGCLLAIPIMGFMKRRTTMVMANVGCGGCLLLIACMPEGIAPVVFACIGMLLSAIVFVVVYLYCTEMFPTVVRNAAMGISSMMARVGSMIAPFVISLKTYGLWCTPVTFGVVPLICSGLCLLLPETKDCELLSTLEEGEALGTNTTSPPSQPNET